MQTMKTSHNTIFSYIVTANVYPAYTHLVQVNKFLILENKTEGSTPVLTGRVG